MMHLLYSTFSIIHILIIYRKIQTNLWTLNLGGACRGSILFLLTGGLLFLLTAASAASILACDVTTLSVCDVTMFSADDVRISPSRNESLLSWLAPSETLLTSRLFMTSRVCVVTWLAIAMLDWLPVAMVTSGLGLLGRCLLAEGLVNLRPPLRK